MVRDGAGGRVRLLASHRDPAAPVLAAADEAFAEPDLDRRADPDGYAGWCIDQCAARGIDLFVAQNGRFDLADRAADFARVGTRLAVPADRATLELIEDKGRFHAAATDHGLPTPWTREIHDAPSFDAALAEAAALGHEPCVKPPHGVFAAGFWRLDPAVPLFATLMNPDAHRIAPAALRAAIADAPDPVRLLVLQHLPGAEWSVDLVADAGTTLVAVARRKLARAQRLEADGPAIDIARDAVRAFGLSGLVNVQLKAATADDRDPRILEINTRMSGACRYTEHAGVNLPWIQIGTLLGLVDRAAIPHPTGGALVAPVTIPERLPDPEAKAAAHA
ncbi:ATP-grasp domain-containing protein [Sphingomonas sp. 1P06PA]|uniref:ATP-grasp domain-containing protein n=1 Tax=Sphingomonas sp. 1P06PA TaxID=554121 RepID=UPI0039A40555